MRINDQKNLRQLVDLVHDHWFDVEKIVFDEHTRSVSMRVEPRHSDLEGGSSDGIIVVVKNVDRLVIEDTEKVRDYDINDIVFDPATQSLVLTGGIPIKIVFRVSTIEVHASSAVRPDAE